MNYEEIKRHFENNPPPEIVEWTGWAKITDTRLFLKSCYIGIRNFNGPIDRCPAWWHLRDFYILMKKNAQQTLAEETQAEEISLETPIQESVQIASVEAEVTV
ncbi:hypothetical protein [uncultured Flavobacterium sp.]|uniref:DUF6965 family protein n=1 Tax=uncultured Flavobacterium sp. TaxID=165435 RepID=UPI002599912D|nr:hypothetical protein [uncultured Flavobacterium sp.]